MNDTFGNTKWNLKVRAMVIKTFLTLSSHPNVTKQSSSITKILLKNNAKWKRLKTGTNH